MSQQFLLPCSCGQKVRVGNAQAGGQVICACGKNVPVPTLRGLRQLEPAPAEVIGKTALHWSPLHGAAFAGALLLATAGVALVALFYYSQLVGWVGNEGYDYTLDRSADMIRGMATQIDKEVDALTPEEVLVKLRETEAEGLGEKGSLPWIVLKERATGHLWWIKAGGGAFLFAAFVVLATLFVGRR
jgi:hypothetical protein